MRKSSRFVAILCAFAGSVAAIVYFDAASRAPTEEPPSRVAQALVRAASAIRRISPFASHELIKRTDLHGRTPKEVSAILGKRPETSEQVKLGDGLSEFQIELYNFFPPDDPNTAHVVVLQEGWAFEGYCITVWYRGDTGDWKAFDSIEYPDDMVF